MVKISPLLGGQIDVDGLTDGLEVALLPLPVLGDPVKTVMVITLLVAVGEDVQTAFDVIITEIFAGLAREVGE
jgi:hypothetical protein